MVREARRADIVHLHSYEGRIILALLRWAGRPMVVHYHGSELRLGRAQVQRRRFKHAFATTPDLLSIYRESFAGTPYEKEVTYTPLPVDLRRLTPRRAEERAARPYVLHSTVNREMKGTDHIASVFARLGAAGIETRIVERRPQAELLREMRRAWVYVGQFPDSPRAPRGVYGMAEVEAMAMGVPVMAAIDRNHYPPGCPVIPSSRERLEDDLVRLMGPGSAELAPLGEKARAYVRAHHDVRTIAQRIEEVYRRFRS